MKIEIQILEPGDIDKFHELLTVFEIGFEMENLNRPGTTYLQHLLNTKTFFAVVALTGDKVIGGLTVYVLHQYYSEKPLAYIYDLAVLPEHQRKGVGKNLVEFTNNYCRQKGFEEVFVQADKADSHALHFYRSVKSVKEAPVVHFSYKL